MTIGIGIGLGFSAGATTLTSAKLRALFAQACGGKAIDQFIGEEATLSAGSLTSWVGASLSFTNGVANRTIATSHSGRRYLSANGAVCNITSTTPVAMKSLLLVVYHAALSAGLYHFFGLTSPRASGRDFLLTYGANFAGSNSTVYVNGSAATASVAGTPYIVEGECPINTATGVQLYSQEGGGNFTTELEVAFAAPLSATLTAGERIACVDLLRRYYRI